MDGGRGEQQHYPYHRRRLERQREVNAPFCPRVAIMLADYPRPRQHKQQQPLDVSRQRDVHRPDDEERHDAENRQDEAAVTIQVGHCVSHIVVHVWPTALQTLLLQSRPGCRAVFSVLNYLVSMLGVSFFFFQNPENKSRADM